MVKLVNTYSLSLYAKKGTTRCNGVDARYIFA